MAKKLFAVIAERKAAWAKHRQRLNENWMGGELCGTLVLTGGPRTRDEARRVLDNFRRRLLRACPGGYVAMTHKGGRVKLRTAGIPADCILRMWNHGTVTVERRIGPDKSRLRVSSGGKAVRNLAEVLRAG